MLIEEEEPEEPEEPQPSFGHDGYDGYELRLEKLQSLGSSRAILSDPCINLSIWLVDPLDHPQNQRT